MPRSTVPRPAPRRASSIQRLMLGTLSVVFLVAGLLMPWLPFGNDSSSGFASGSLLKVGVVLFIAWLAAPQLERFGWQRLRGTMLIGLIIVLVLFAYRPKIGAIAAAVFVGGSMVFGAVGWLRKISQPPRR